MSPTSSPPPGLRLGGWITFATLLLLPGVAFAGGGGGEGAEETTAEVVFLLLLVGAAYLVTHFVLDRMQSRLLVLAGVEYIILGVLLGPVVPQIHAFDDLSALLPIIALAAGWIGLVRGMELNLSHFRDAPGGSVRLALGDDLIAGVLTAVGCYLFLASGTLGEIPDDQAWLAGAFMGCCAATGSTDPIDVIKKRYHVEGKTVPLLRRSARLGDALALFAFGLLFCIFHVTPEGVTEVLSATEWAVVALLIGVILGLLFRYFLGAKVTENGRFLTLVGVISFASGAAWFLNLSPLLINLVLGMVLVNTADAGPQIQGTLERTERPMSLVLLLFAGALWQPPEPVTTAFDRMVESGAHVETFLIAVGWWVVMPLAFFAVLRMTGKWLGSRLAAWGQEQRGDLFRGLLGHGDVTVAMAISFRLVYDGLAVDVAYTVVILSVVLHDLFAPRALRALLVDAGDLRKEQQEPAS